MVAIKSHTLLTIWVARNDLTFNNTMWDVKKTRQLIQQSLLEYTKIAWETTQTSVDKVLIYDDVIGKYNEIWGGNELLYNRDNTRSIHGNIKMPNIGLVIMFKVFTHDGMF